MSRLETLCLMADVDVPLVAVRRQLVEAVDIIVQVERRQSRRRVSAISEVMKDENETGSYRMRPLFALDGDGPDAALVPANAPRGGKLSKPIRQTA
jgi:pilus assembly protein CpaF